MLESPPDGPLVLGPVLRYVGATQASLWLQTRDASTVTVERAGRSWRAHTFAVEGHHYALVVLDDLVPGSTEEYAVSVGDEAVWPLRGGHFPPSRLVTPHAGRPPRFAFGSCRTTAAHDAEGNKKHGVDALRALALALIDGEVERPDFIAFLGDQVYADKTSEAMQSFIGTRRDLEEEPGTEIKDFTEYAHLYQLAWSDPTNRWLLSTVPSCMIFDDHDVRDDWNTSWDWREEINESSWWHERLVGALVSYWVYQHVGNLSPDALAADPVWSRVAAHEESGEKSELDLTAVLRDLAERADRDPAAYRWSYERELGDCRLVVVDSRAARVLRPGSRAMLDDTERAWLDERLTGDVDHLFIGTSLPFLLPPGLHDAEALSEVAARGTYGRSAARVAERLRQVVDLEHWAAFDKDFSAVFDMVLSVARGERGAAPSTVTFLSGDVHHSYVAEVLPERSEERDAGAGAGPAVRSRVVQAVCSPIRNPMPRQARALVSGFARGLSGPMDLALSRTKKVPRPAYPWAITHGPWYDNNVAVIDVDGPRLQMSWLLGDVTGGDDDHPVLREVFGVTID